MSHVGEDELSSDDELSKDMRRYFGPAQGEFANDEQLEV